MHMLSGRYRKPKLRKRRKKSPTVCVSAEANSSAAASSAAAGSTGRHSLYTLVPERRTSKRRAEPLEEHSDSSEEEKREDERSFDEDMIFWEPTATERKINYFQVLLPLKQNSDSESDYVLINRTVMENLVSCFKCPACESKNLKIRFVGRHGFSIKMRCFCTSCDQGILGDYASARVQNESPTRPPFKVNRSITDENFPLRANEVGYRTQMNPCNPSCGASG